MLVFYVCENHNRTCILAVIALGKLPIFCLLRDCELPVFSTEIAGMCLYSHLLERYYRRLKMQSQVVVD